MCMATFATYTLSLHDALPIYVRRGHRALGDRAPGSSPAAVDCGGRIGTGRVVRERLLPGLSPALDRKSTRLNSSHLGISYAVFCLKKKKKITNMTVSPTRSRR